MISPVNGQDIAALAMKARIHLYDHWNFDSTEYYLNLVIGEKYAPAFAYSDYGWFLLLKDQPKRGRSNILKAVKMSPKDQQLLTWQAWADLWYSDLRSAKKFIDQALQINANNGETLYVASLIASNQSKYNEALRYAEQAAQNDPTYRAGIALALVNAGKIPEARNIAERISKDLQATDAMILMETYAHMNDPNQALNYLEKAYELRHPFLPWLKGIPALKELQDDLRFRDIVRKINLPK